MKLLFSLRKYIALLLAIPQALMGAFVFSCMWNWFVVGKFPNMPHMSTADAVGLLMIVAFLFIPLILMNLKGEVKRAKPDIGNESINVGVSVVMIVVAYPIILGIAWIWHLINAG